MYEAKEGTVIRHGNLQYQLAKKIGCEGHFCFYGFVGEDVRDRWQRGPAFFKISPDLSGLGPPTVSFEVEKRFINDICLSGLRVYRPPCLAIPTEIFETTGPRDEKKPWGVRIFHYFPQGAVDDIIARHEKPLDIARAVKIFMDVSQGLAFMHERDCLHRDIKPSNILVDRESGYLADFNIYQGPSVRGLIIRGVSLDDPNYFSGTEDFICPEIIPSHSAIFPRIDMGRFDRRSDIYHLGMSLFIAITDEHPLGVGDDDSFYLQMRKALFQEPRKAAEINPAIPPEADKIIQKALEKDPDKRQQTAEEFRQELNGLLLLLMNKREER
ncbi:protein kinase [Candidatus Woesearchaeota archaeon]|nr:protein kinase [Candidatus Woesearchaeota archaeon]